MAVEFARIAEVWHHFQVDVMFITSCSRALAGADAALPHGNALVLCSWGLGLLSELHRAAR